MLYEILTDRKAVNILKILSENDDVFNLKELKLSENSAKKLYDNGLIQLDNELVSISLQGKQFIKLMDEMKKVVEKGLKKNGVKIGFNLKKEEREILLKISKMGFDVKTSNLLKKLKKDKTVKSKTKLNKMLKSLQEINLVEVDGKNVSITELGKKTIINELLDEFNLA